MSNWKDRQVLIVGGGIGGLAAALALARKGIPSQVIEQAPEFKEIGPRIQLGPNVFWMFEALGLVEPISALAVFPNNLVMMDSVTGQEVTRIPLGESFRKKFHHPYALIHRADLHKVLLQACQKSDLVRLDASQKVVKVDETADGIMVHTESGKEYRSAALIGADGLWSTIRQMVVGDGQPKPAGHITYRAVLPTSEMPEQYRWRDMVLWAGEKVHLVHYPLRTGELFNLVAVFHSNRYEEGWDSYGDPAELHERFAKTCAPVAPPPKQNERLAHVGVVRPAADQGLEPRPHHASRRCGPSDAAISGARRRHVDRGRGVTCRPGCRVARRLCGGVSRLSAGALSAHRPRPDHGAGLRRILSRRRRRQGATQHDARLTHARRRHGRDGMALRQAARAHGRGNGAGVVSMRGFSFAAVIAACASLAVFGSHPAHAADDFFSGK